VIGKIGSWLTLGLFCLFLSACSATLGATIGNSPELPDNGQPVVR